MGKNLCNKFMADWAIIENQKKKEEPKLPENNYFSSRARIIINEKVESTEPQRKYETDYQPF
jgi:hypothetical protein